MCSLWLIDIKTIVLLGDRRLEEPCAVLEIPWSRTIAAHRIHETQDEGKRKK